MRGPGITFFKRRKYFLDQFTTTTLEQFPAKKLVQSMLHCILSATWEPKYRFWLMMLYCMHQESLEKRSVLERQVVY